MNKQYGSFLCSAAQSLIHYQISPLIFHVSTQVGVGHLSRPTGVSSGWSRAAQRPKFKIPRFLELLSQYS